MLRRILVKGTSGSGKSTLGRRLASELGLPYVELDALHFGPNWSTVSPAELRARIDAALDDARGWVVDGNYDSKLGRNLLDRAQLVVWLDLPLPLKLGRLAERSASRFRTREPLWHDNRETLKSLFWGGDGLFTWTVRSHFRHRRKWPKLFHGKPFVRLTSEAAIASWLEHITVAAALSH